MIHAILLLLPLLSAGNEAARNGTELLFKSGSLSVHFQKEGTQRWSYLMRNGTHRGGNFRPSDGQGGPSVTREVVGYHHRLGPVGQMMTRFNWFSGPDGKTPYAADARMPASLVGLSASLSPGMTLPTGTLVGAWSEPPYATVGMYVGSMATYARPFQHVHFFESDTRLVKLALPEPSDPVFFHFILDAVGRGAELRIQPSYSRSTLASKAPRSFYHAVFVEVCPRDRLDDLNVAMMTKEGIASLFETLAPKGVLCFHTSNRYINVVPVLADVADSLGLACKVGSDRGGGYVRGQFSSEWVLLARDPAHLDHLRDTLINGQPVLTWKTPKATGQPCWTDAHQSFRSLYRAEPSVFEARQRISQSVQSVFRRLGISSRRTYEFDRFTFQCAQFVSQAALQVRERYYVLAESVKR
jgi:hypothetical protein